MIRTLSDAVGFLLVGTILPCCFLAITGTPSAMLLWLAVWVGYIAHYARHRRGRA